MSESTSQALFSLAGFQVTIIGRFWVTAEADCSFTSLLAIPIHGVPSSVTINGVSYNEGHDFHAMAMDEAIPFSFIEGERIGP